MFRGLGFECLPTTAENSDPCEALETLHRRATLGEPVNKRLTFGDVWVFLYPQKR